MNPLTPDKSPSKSKRGKSIYVIWAVIFVGLYIKVSETTSSDWAGVGFGVAFALIGLIFIGPPVLSIFIGSFIKRKLILKGYSKKISIVIGVTAALALLSVPFLDYPYKKMLLNEYCAKEGGFHISKTVTGVEGIYGLPNATNYGYGYGEVYRDPSDKTSLRRIYDEKIPSGGFLEIKVDNPSPYGFRENRTHVASSIYRVDLQTYITSTGEELGRYVNFESYAPSDSNVSFINVMRFWMRMSCPDTKNDNGIYKFLPELLHKTLQPAVIDSALA